MKTREIKELTTKEIVELLDAEKMNLDKMVLNHAISPLDRPDHIRESRRTIARFATELRQRELNKQ